MTTTPPPPEHFHLFLGIVLCVTGTAMLLYVRLRPDYRRYPVLFGALANLSGGLFWVLSGAAVETPGRVQVLFGALRALPYEFALAYVCYLVVRSIGKNHPRTERVLATGPYVLPLLPFLIGTVCAIFFPQPAIDSVVPGTAELLVPRLRNFVEIGYLMLITSVFFRASLRRSTPILRIQNASLTVVGMSFLTALAANLIIAAARVLAPDRAALNPLLDLWHTVQLAAMTLAGCGFLIGIAFYYSAEEREALLERCRDWIRHRHEIEAAAYSVFGTGLGASASGAKTAAYFYRSAAMLGILPRQQEQGRLTIALLALMLDPGYQELVTKVQAAQRELLDNPESASLYLGHLGDGIHYDIRDDALYNALEPARTLSELANTRSCSQPDHLPPVWIQLAAALAADARFLPEPAQRMILSGRSQHASPRVLDTYLSAKDIENRVHNRGYHPSHADLDR